MHRLSDEARIEALLDHIADSPPRLRMFPQAMPKGADLHNHGGGSIYAEDSLRWAAADGLCIATDKLRIVDPPCDAPNRAPAAGLEHDYRLYSAMIDALSTRGFEAGVGDPEVSGYDRFFATFGKFSAASHGNGGKAIAATRQQAAADHVAYVELSTGAREAAPLAAAVSGVDPSDFAAMSPGSSRCCALPPALRRPQGDRPRRAAVQLPAGCEPVADRAGRSRVAACTVFAAQTCTTFVTASPRAAQQRRLESDLAAFEAGH